MDEIIKFVCEDMVCPEQVDYMNDHVRQSLEQHTKYTHAWVGTLAGYVDSVSAAMDAMIRNVDTANLIHEQRIAALETRGRADGARIAALEALLGAV